MANEIKKGPVRSRAKGRFRSVGENMRKNWCLLNSICALMSTINCKKGK
ncbi:hypothetical protein [Caudoviricetes sp.]|nr:hypothetical protein [Caudoviricetes sp.]